MCAKQARGACPGGHAGAALWLPWRSGINSVLSPAASLAPHPRPTGSRLGEPGFTCCRGLRPCPSRVSRRRKERRPAWQSVCRDRAAAAGSSGPGPPRAKGHRPQGRLCPTPRPRVCGRFLSSLTAGAGTGEMLVSSFRLCCRVTRSCMRAHEDVFIHLRGLVFFGDTGVGMHVFVR